MYNHNIKKMFIDERQAEVSVDKYFLQNIFRRSQPFEERVGKDVCNFTTREIENMYRTLDYKSYDSLIVANSTYAVYTSWSLAQGFVHDSQNHFLELTRDRLAEMINIVIQESKMIDKEKIINWCAQLPNAADAFLILGLFEGISGKNYCEFVNAHAEDIDTKQKTIKLYRRDEPLSISAELCQTGLDAAKDCIYRSLMSSNQREFELERSSKIIKDFPNTDPTDDEFRLGRRVYGRIRRSLAFLGEEGRYSPSDIIKSGMLYMITTESEKIGITPIEYVEQYLTMVSKRFKKSRLEKKDFLRKYRRYLE